MSPLWQNKQCQDSQKVLVKMCQFMVNWRCIVIAQSTHHILLLTIESSSMGQTGLLRCQWKSNFCLFLEEIIREIDVSLDRKKREMLNGGDCDNLVRDLPFLAPFSWLTALISHFSLFSPFSLMSLCSLSLRESALISEPFREKDSKLILPLARARFTYSRYL